MLTRCIHAAMRQAAYELLSNSHFGKLAVRPVRAAAPLEQPVEG